MVLLLIKPDYSYAQLKCEQLFSTNVKVHKSAKSKVLEVKPVDNTEAIKGIQESLQSAIEGINFNAIFLQGEKPKWNDYNHLVQVLNELSKYNLDHLTAADKNILAEKFRPHYEDIELNVNHLVSGNKAVFKKFLDENYNYFNLIRQINARLGVKVLPEHQLSLVKSNEAVRQEALKILKQQQIHFAKELKETGFESVDHLLNAVKAPPEKLKASIDFAQNKLVVGIHLKESSRFWVPIAGFQNQRIVGRSNGGYNVNRMNEVESYLIRESTDEFALRSVRVMPVYGEIIPDPTKSTLSSPKYMDPGYGSDIWILKDQSIKNRTTFTDRDSWNLYTTKGWHEIGIPYSHKKLIALGLKDISTQTQFKTHRVTAAWGSSKLPKILKEIPLFGHPFVEAQVWGGASIKDVKAFIFRETEPSLEFYNYLKSQSIKIYDGRGDKNVPYVMESKNENQ